MMIGVESSTQECSRRARGAWGQVHGGKSQLLGKGGKFGNWTNGQKRKGRHHEQGNYIVIAVEMLTNPFESMVINGNVAQSMTFNVYGNGNQPTDNTYF